jgi:hypothetical protein
MTYLTMVLSFLHDWFRLLANVIRVKTMSRAALEIENLALRSQLALYQQRELNYKYPNQLLSRHFANCGFLFRNFGLIGNRF